MNLMLIVKMEAGPGMVETVDHAMTELADKVRAEVGCIQFDLLRDLKNPNMFVVYEIWESRELWQNHLTSPHMKDFNELINRAVSSFSVDELTDSTNMRGE